MRKGRKKGRERASFIGTVSGTKKGQGLMKKGDDPDHATPSQWLQKRERGKGEDDPEDIPTPINMHRGKKRRGGENP